MRIFCVAASVSALLLSVAGCGGANPPAPRCSPAFTYAMSAPANGATNVPTNVGSIVLSVSNIQPGLGSLPATLAPVTLTPTQGAAIQSGTLQNSANVLTGSLPTLLPTTTYTVSQTFVASPPCPTSAVVGSFTTSSLAQGSVGVGESSRE